MQRRIIFTLLCAAVIALSVVLRSHSSEAAASKTSTPAAAADTTVSAVLNLTVGARVSFELTVTNNSGRRVELRFPNGKTHDFVVVDSVGKEVWRWSEGRLFTQVLQNRLLEANESIRFVESWKNPDTTGTFTAVAQLQSRNFPLEQRALLVLPSQRY